MDLTMVYVSWDDCGGAVLRCHQHDAWELPLVGDNDTVPRVVEQAEQHVTEDHRPTIDDQLIEVTAPKPELYVINMSTGEVTGGPEPGIVQHWDRETFELVVHEYAPDSCERCKELRDLGFEDAP
ncbi:hypothetical protein [Micromonospora chokoriensis]|uniref:hypothetical protein n=1 Tax=Micromonospora chokoriensis TaxID=356851 RepID=UPI0004C3AC6E|nr:hypothetical protein [Micromonospora chokoriensis]